jgi:2-polyprenyl-3-methyl-5-hydroxy-6-metoxy-1,4-benzoquinol methylase
MDEERRESEAEEVAAPGLRFDIRSGMPIRARHQLTCYLCGSQAAILYGGLKDRLFSVPGVWSLRRCSSDTCGLVWLDPSPVEQDIPSLYATYFTHSRVRARTLARRSALREEIAKTVLANYFDYAVREATTKTYNLTRLVAGIPFVRKRVGRQVMWLSAVAGGRLLDYGCGGGRFLAGMHERGWEVKGYEPDVVAAQTAREVHGLDVVDGVFAPESLGEKTYDAVTLIHVIEHVPDPVETLRQCARLLKPGGSLVLATPNLSSLGHLVFRGNWLDLDPPRHLMLFTPTSLERVIEKAKLRIVSIFSNANPPKDNWIRSRMIAARGHLDTIDVSEIAGLRLRLEGSAFSLIESLATTIVPVGEELVAILKA